MTELAKASDKYGSATRKDAEDDAGPSRSRSGLECVFRGLIDRIFSSSSFILDGVRGGCESAKESEGKGRSGVVEIDNLRFLLPILTEAYDTDRFAGVTDASIILLGVDGPDFDFWAGEGVNARLGG